MADADKTLIFLHIHKTAGTSLQRLLMRHYSSDALYVMDQHYYRMQEGIDNFRTLDVEARRRTDCLICHIGYGVHELVPRAPAYITMLREPVSRTISQYYWMRDLDASYIKKALDQKSNLSLYERRFREHLRPEDTPGNSLDAFVDMFSAAEAMNLQTRMIGGFQPLDGVLPPYPPLPENALERAKENLRRNISVCGLTERFDESVLLMQSVFGWKNVYYTSENVTRRPSHRPSIAAATRRRIESECELDTELYAYAQRLFAERLLEIPDLTASALRRYRHRNALYQRLRKVYDRSGLWRVKVYLGKLKAASRR